MTAPATVVGLVWRASGITEQRAMLQSLKSFFFSSAFKILLTLKLLACLRHSVSKRSATENGAITEMKRKRERDLGQVGLRCESKSLSPGFFAPPLQSCRFLRRSILQIERLKWTMKIS